MGRHRGAEPHEQRRNRARARVGTGAVDEVETADDGGPAGAADTTATPHPNGGAPGAARTTPRTGPTPVHTPERPGPDAIASARALTKVYGAGETQVRALDGVDVDLARGSLTAVMGPSGSGKSTLMHCLAGLDSPTSGSVIVDGVEISRMSQRQLTKLRRTRIGFVFQAYNLVPTLTAAENIRLPLDIARKPVDKARFDAVVRAVGLEDRLHHRPSELSGGQQQRVACARALVAEPSVVFADEPTGNLDSRSAAEVLGFLRRSVDDLGHSVVMVTHEPSAAAYAHRVLFLADGRLEAELLHPEEGDILAAIGELSAARERRQAAPGATAAAGDGTR
ncbi:ATP-binding cassette domain-containing protein [Georgenia thermotolerans]|uniref:ATP-binding cassette domain-containing protein n=1 Tax=Georgenia thermotolerans TaxID=527326 RepID=A0A7J5UQD4_9MICO|nr:ABC transporter ATP-binding protein [Georgenia thermotolerans]KAE8764628.1 ATP-binding cassette domain-containing protein [Georgenia thermotolerans]